MMFSNEQMEEMSKEAEAIADLVKATEKLLNEKSSKKSKKKNENVVYVDFSLKREFEKAKKLSLKMPQILAVYHDWAFRTNQLAKANKGNLKNKSVRDMIQLNHDIVCTIVDIFPK